MYIPICTSLFTRPPGPPAQIFRRMSVLTLTAGFPMADEATVPTPYYPAQPDMDSQIIQDLLPGTGSLGSVPMHHVRALSLWKRCVPN